MSPTTSRGQSGEKLPSSAPFCLFSLSILVSAQFVSGEHGRWLLLGRPVIHNILPLEILGGEHTKSNHSAVHSSIIRTFIKCLHSIDFWHLVGKQGINDEENVIFFLREFAVYHKYRDGREQMFIITYNW